MSRPLGIEDDDSKESVEEYKNRLRGGEMGEYEDDYAKLLNYCAEIVKANIERFKDVPLNDIKASIEAELEMYQEGGEMKTMEEQFAEFLDNHQKMRNKTRRKPRGIKRYKCYGYDGDPSMSVDRDGEYVKYSDYEKLLAKYNGVFEWLPGRHDITWEPSDEVKRLYEEDTKDAK